MHPRRLRTVSLALVLSLAVWGCASKYQALTVTGETLDAMGQQFLAAGRTYDRLFDAQRITPQEYQDWANFSRRFSVLYPEAVVAWKAGKETDDTLTLILQLKSQLLEFYLYTLSQ